MGQDWGLTGNGHRWIGHALAAAGLALSIRIKLDLAELRGAVDTLPEVVAAQVDTPNLHANRRAAA